MREKLRMALSSLAYKTQCSRDRLGFAAVTNKTLNISD